MKILNYLLLVVAVGVLVSCKKKEVAPPEPRDTIVQVGSLEALKQGSCESRTTVGATRAHGDLALGYSKGLGSEFIMLSNKAYRTAAQGALIPSGETDELAFATAAFFEPDLMFDIGPTPRKIYENAMDMKRPSPGRIYAYRIHGAFSRMTVRQLPPALDPCEKLTRALNHVETTEHTNVTGTLFGFWSPRSLRVIAGEGYEYGFVSAAGDFGGRVTDFEITQARIEIDDSDEVLIKLE